MSASDPDYSTDSVFAAYGRAMHGAQALEYWLRILVTANRTVAKDFTSEDELERAVETLSISTMGTIVAALRTLASDPQLEALLTRAVAERNSLAHQFFGKWSEIWDGPEADIHMIQDVERTRELFEEAIGKLVSVIGTHLDTIGENPDEYIPGLKERIANVHSASKEHLDTTS